MYLQLAEGEYNPPSMYFLEERTKVRGYRRKANTVRPHFRTLSEELDIEDNPYVFIPDLTGQTAGYQVREDYFDGLTDQQWKNLMYELLPYQVPVRQGMSEDMYLAGLFGTRASRQAKRDAKIEKKTAKTDIKKAKADSIRSGASTGGGGVLDKISGVLGGIAGGILGITPAGAQTPGAPASPSFWDDTTMGINNKIAIPGAILLTAGAVYGINKFRKRRRKR